MRLCSAAVAEFFCLVLAPLSLNAQEPEVPAPAITSAETQPSTHPIQTFPGQRQITNVPAQSAPLDSGPLLLATGPAAVTAAAIRIYRPPTVPTRQPVTGKKFLLLNGLHLGLALADIHTTQQCLAHHTCREGNPLMPSSSAGQYGISVGLVTMTAAGSYWLKRHNSPHWWIAPVIGISAHSAGLASGLANR
jgi:hypothetical protein